MPNLFGLNLGGNSGKGKKVSPTEEIGTVSPNVYAGYVQSAEESAELQGSNKYKKFSEMVANVNIVAAGVRLFLNYIGKAQWIIEPADDSPKAIEIAEEVSEILMTHMERPWHKVVRRIATFKLYGFSVAEWTAKKLESGTIGYKDIAPRPQRTIIRWDVDEHGRVGGMTQRHNLTYQEMDLPRSKVVYAVDDTLSDSPEGQGLFRHMVLNADSLTRYEQLEKWGFDNDLRGVPVARAPYSLLNSMVETQVLTAAQRDEILKPLKDYIDGHIKGPTEGLLLDSATYSTADEANRPSNVNMWGLELLESGATSLGEIAAAITRKNHELARVLGVEHLMLGQDRGTQSLSRDKSDIFGLITNGTLLEVAEVINEDVIGPLMDLNGWPQELRPKAKPEAIQFRDVEQLTQALKDLASAALDPEDEAEDVVRDLLGLPHAPEATAFDEDLTLTGKPEDKEEV